MKERWNVLWLLRIFIRCMDSGFVPYNLNTVCIVPIWKEKCDRRECANFRGISTWIMPRKIYGKVFH